MTKEIKHTGSFVATDENGDEHTVFVFSEYNVIRDRGAKRRVPGLKSLQLSDGRHVNRVDKGHYELVDTPMVKLTSNNPSAP